LPLLVEGISVISPFTKSGDLPSAISSLATSLNFAGIGSIIVCKRWFGLLYALMVNSVAQEGGNVTGTLRHRYDLNGAALSAVNHEIRTDWPEQNRV